MRLIILFAILAGFVSGSLADEPVPASGPVVPERSAGMRTGDLPVMRKHGVVRALVTVSRTDFFLDKGRPLGLQVELLEHYEKFLNKGKGKYQRRMSVDYIPVTFDQLLPALEQGKGDIAADLLTVTPDREARVSFVSNGAMDVNEILVTAKGVAGVESLEDLSGRTLYILRGSSYGEHLQALNERFKKAGLAPVRIKEADSRLLVEDILELVNAGVVEMTVVDDFSARLWSQVLPNLVLRDTIRINTKGSLGWAVRRDNPELHKSLTAFSRRYRKGTLLGNVLFNRYYKDAQWISNPLSDGERRKLGQFVNLFKKYGERYGFDYLALAAQAYQESGLDNSKRNKSGARGIMQLKPSTAADKNVGISNIHKVENNIHAGTRYLAYLRDRYFSGPDFSAEDRMAFSWAAYNAGPASVIRMRDKAVKMGLDPNQWFQNVEFAALKTVGQEPVRYVANIYKYYTAYRLMEEAMPNRAGL